MIWNTFWSKQGDGRTDKVHIEELNNVATVTKASRKKWDINMTYVVENIKNKLENYTG
jgi:hypothetical protein